MLTEIGQNAGPKGLLKVKIMVQNTSDLDRFDQAILATLAEDGRISITDLSKRIGLSKSPTQARLRRLEENGVILGYRAMLNPIRLGLDHVAFVEVKLSDTREAALAAFNKAVVVIPEAASKMALTAPSSGRPR